MKLFQEWLAVRIYGCNGWTAITLQTLVAAQTLTVPEQRRPAVVIAGVETGAVVEHPLDEVETLAVDRPVQRRRAAAVHQVVARVVVT